jgi:uncharacterized protein involved in type VI secretion and phage assembly
VRVGVISSYDPATHAVKLTMQPEGIQTGWVSIATDGIGNGFGIYSGPTIGDSVIVAYHEGDKKTPIVIGRLPTNEETPIPTQSGEIIAQSAFSSFLKLLMDGSVTLQDKGGASIAFDGQGNITATGRAGQSIAFGASGDIILTDKGGATIELDGSGNITLAAAGSGKVTVNNLVITGTVTGAGGGAITGALNMAGNITAGFGGADSVTLQGHKHTANNTSPTPGT